jgi:hypothetical protein
MLALTRLFRQIQAAYNLQMSLGRIVDDDRLFIKKYVESQLRLEYESFKRSKLAETLQQKGRDNS